MKTAVPDLSGLVEKPLSGKPLLTVSEITIYYCGVWIWIISINIFVIETK
jgi:hypothetical protein